MALAYLQPAEIPLPGGRMAIAFRASLKFTSIGSSAFSKNGREIDSWCFAAPPYLHIRIQFASRRNINGRAAGQMWFSILISWYRRFGESARRYWWLHKHLLRFHYSYGNARGAVEALAWGMERRDQPSSVMIGDLNRIAIALLLFGALSAGSAGAEGFSRYALTLEHEFGAVYHFDLTGNGMEELVVIVVDRSERVPRMYVSAYLHTGDGFQPAGPPLPVPSSLALAGVGRFGEAPGLALLLPDWVEVWPWRDGAFHPEEHRLRPPVPDLSESVVGTQLPFHAELQQLLYPSGAKIRPACRCPQGSWENLPMPPFPPWRT